VTTEAMCNQGEGGGWVVQCMSLVEGGGWCSVHPHWREVGGAACVPGIVIYFILFCFNR
jgi:hypothetical protein